MLWRARPLSPRRRPEGQIHIKISRLVQPMAKSPKNRKPVVKTYSAPLERLRSGLGWVIAYLPFDASDAWGSRGRLKVKGEINGFAFRTSLFPTRDGRHFLLINKRMQKGAHAVEGTVARFRLESDLEERTVTVPEELMSAMEAERELPPMLQVAFARNPRAREGWEQMSDIRRRGQLLAIFYYRTPESRARRLSKVMEEAVALAEKKSIKT